MGPFTKLESRGSRTMTETTLLSPTDWSLRRWALLAGGTVLLGFAAFALSAMAGGAELDVGVAWPNDLAPKTPAELSVQVHDRDDDAVSGTTVELHYVPLDPEPDPASRRRQIAERLSDGRSERLSSTTTDESGFAAVRLPAAEKFVEPREPSETQSEDSSDSSRRPPSSITLALRVNPEGAEAIELATFDPPSPVDLALTTDRPLYEPGQTMLLRTTAVAPISGAPADGRVRWTIRDPRDNLVFRDEGPLGEFGIDSTRFELADRAPSGTYTIEAEVAGETVEKSVDVRPFRLPRFEVDVTADETASAGESLRGEVRATYTWGSPVEDADVDIDFTAPAPGDIRLRQRTTGETDDDGIYRFEWEVPSDAGIGSTSPEIEIHAVVSTEAGRKGEDDVRLPIRKEALRLEVLPAPHASRDEFVLVLRTADGRPIGDAEITVHIPEREGERKVEVTTDERGLGTSRWKTLGGTSTLRLRIDAPDRKPFRRTVEVTDQARDRLSLPRPTAEVGQEVAFEVDTPAKGATVGIVKRGAPLRTTHVPYVTGETSVGTLTVPPNARGLAYVVAYGNGGHRIGAAPLWVHQESPEEVTLETRRDEYRPGQQVDLALSYPPRPKESSQAGDQSPVAFGLFGADEALYVLEERTDLPLPRLLHESADAAEAASRAVAALETAAGSDAESRASRLHASARFYESLGNHRTPTHDGTHSRDVTEDVAAASWRMRYTIFSLLVGLGALTLLLLAGRLPLEQIRREEFDEHAFVRSIGLFIVGLVGLGVVGVLLAAVGGLGATVGGAIVWLLTAGGFVVDAIRRHDDLDLLHWLGLVGIALAVGFTALLPWIFQMHAEPASLIPFRLLGAAAVLLLLAQVGGWVVVLQNREHWSSTTSMLTVFWLLVPLGLATLVANCSKSRNPFVGSEEQAAMRDAPGEKEKTDRFATVVEASSGADEDSSGGDRVRDYFPETMVWEPRLLSDSQGRAELSVEAPDSITTWRLTAMAQTRDGRFAESDHSLVVRKPLFVNLELPEHATAGDVFRVPVTVSNEATESDDSSEPTKVEIEAETDGALTLGAAAPGGPNPSVVTLEPGSRRVVDVPVRARDTGRGTLTVRANPVENEIEADAVRRSVQVRPDGRNRTSSASGIVGDNWTTRLPVPKDAISNTVAVDAAVSASAVADAIEGLDALLATPSGCFEQVSSTNYPNVMILRRLETTEPEEWPDGEEAWREAKRRAERLVSLGYQKMLSFQTSDGGFRLYPKPKYEPDPMLTAYGLMQLAAMDGVMELDLEPVMRQTARWLTARQNTSGTWPVYAAGLAGGRSHGEDVGQVRSTAFVAWALLQLPERLRDTGSIERALDHVEEAAPDVSDPNALAVAANALLADGRRDAADGLLDRLASSAVRERDGAYWSPPNPTWIGGSHRYADIETTAIAAHAFSVAESRAELLGETLEYLADERSPRGGWGTTQSTVWALRAFEKLRADTSDEPVVLELYSDGQPMSRSSGRGDDGRVRLAPDDQRLVSFESRSDGSGPVSLRADASTSTNAMVRATAHYAVPWSSPRARSENAAFDLEMEIERRRTQPKARVDATAVVENRTETHHGATIVELPLPPGGWTDRQQFDDLKAGDRIEHFEVLPTHVRLYLSGVEPRERLEFPWSFTPTLEGQYSLPPLRAYPFYVPRPRSETDGGDLFLE